MEPSETIPVQTHSLPLSQSSTRVCLLCKRCYMFKYRWLIAPRRPAPRVAADQGRMVHWLMEHGPESQGEFEQDVQEKIAPLEQLIDSGQDPLGEVASQIKTVLDSSSRALAIAALIWARHPASDSLTTLCREEYIQTGLLLHDEHGEERSFEIEGTVDHLVQDKDSGRTWIRDTKTTSRDPAQTLTGYQYSLQCRFYRLLAESWLWHQLSPEAQANLKMPKGFHVYGFVIDVIRMPTIILSGADRDYTEAPHTFTRGARKGQTEMRREYTGEPLMKNYIKRCVEWYAAEDIPPVESHAIAYTENALNPELYQALRIANTYATCDPDPELFPKDITASYCKAYERVCDFYPLCSSDYSKWPALIETAYRFCTPEEVRTHQIITPNVDPSSQEG